MRPQALALSPDVRLLVTSGRVHQLVVLDPATGEIRQRVALPTDVAPQVGAALPTVLDPNKNAQLSFTGLIFSPDGSRIFMSNVNDDIKVFSVDKNGHVTGLHSLPLPLANAPRRAADIPTGLAISRDGKRLYVALNLSNRVIELDSSTGKQLRIWNVGVAPYDVVLAGDKLYVSNWGGRRPEKGSLTGPAGRGTLVRVDPVRYVASEGSVSVIDLNDSKSNEPWLEILTGMHAAAMTLSPDGRYLVVANTSSDTLSVIDTRSDKIVDTLSARQQPGDPFGAQPNALAFDRSGRRLYVCNGTQNAVAVFQFKTRTPFLGLFGAHRFRPGHPKLLGLIPVGWYPGAIAYDANRKSLYVANIKDISEGRKRKDGKKEFNTHQYCGTLSLIPVPPEDKILKTN